MIKVNRNSRDSNGDLIKPADSWFSKAREATIRAIEEGKSHKVEDIYRHYMVKAALEELFKCCAYCGRKLPETTWDIEHFRPKNRIAECPEHTGYKWLAYDWNNLYPSCKECNQKRFDQPIWGDLRRLEPSKGKGDQFPLVDENTRAMTSTHDTSKEKKLLIDPCQDDPEEYITYDISGEIHSINNNLYAKATIEILNLKRRRLVKARKIVANASKDLLQMIFDLKKKGRDVDATNFDRWYDNIMTCVGCEFAALNRDIKKDPSKYGVEY